VFTDAFAVNEKESIDGVSAIRMGRGEKVVTIFGPQVIGQGGDFVKGVIIGAS
jgi:hypothetical protein